MDVFLVTCEEELQSSLKAFSKFFQLPYNWQVVNANHLPKNNKQSFILVQNCQPEKLNLLHWLQQLRKNPDYCYYPVLFLSDSLSDDVKMMVDELDLLYLANEPFDSYSFFKLTDSVAKTLKTNQSVLAARKKVQTAIQNGEYLEASEQLDILERGLNHPFRFNLLAAQVYSGLGDQNRALIFAKKALSINEHSIEARNLEASTFFKMGDKANYQKSLDHVVKIAEVHLQNLLHWGDVYLERGITTRSRSTYQQALDTDPQNERAKLGLIASDLLDGKAKLDDKLTIDALEVARSFNMRGISMVQNGNFKVAEKLYTNAVRLIKDPAICHKLWLNLGLCMKKKGDLPKAIEYFSKCEEISPDGSSRARAQIDQINAQLKAERDSVAVARPSGFGISINYKNIKK